MYKVGKFEKVSFDNFRESILVVGDGFDSGLLEQLADPEYLQHRYDVIKLPTRATTGSAGYDFYAPFELLLYPHQTVKFPTGIRVKIDDGWFLCCVPRSSLGFKYRLQLDNTVGIIDSDYYFSKNEGHIMVSMTNCSDDREPIHIPQGSAFMQGIFLPYGLTYDDNVIKIRDGGIGSTT